MKIKFEIYPIPFGCCSIGIRFHSGNFFRLGLFFDLLILTIAIYFKDDQIIKIPMEEYK